MVKVSIPPKDKSLGNLETRFMNKSIARKELSRKIKGNKETIVNEYHSFEFDKKLYSTLVDIFDDYEYAQDHGVYTDEDDVYLIDVDMVIDELKDRISDDEEDSIRGKSHFTDRQKSLLKYLEKWKGYKIWL